MEHRVSLTKGCCYDTIHELDVACCQSIGLTSASLCEHDKQHCVPCGKIRHCFHTPCRGFGTQQIDAVCHRENAVTTPTDTDSKILVAYCWHVDVVKASTHNITVWYCRSRHQLCLVCATTTAVRGRSMVSPPRHAQSRTMNRASTAANPYLRTAAVSLFFGVDGATAGTCYCNSGSVEQIGFDETQQHRRTLCPP